MDQNKSPFSKSSPGIKDPNMSSKVCTASDPF